jgi:glycosyltransferase involved in cell wall biosynthesis
VLDKIDARLIIVGEGRERKNLEALVNDMNLRDKIDFTGQLLNPFPLVRRSDVFVLSSDYEGLPNSLIEAMACGTQVVSTDGEGGAGEILMNGALGRLIPVNDAGALTTAMIIALEKKIPREELVRSTERFDAAKVAAEYFSLLEKVCEQ